jgi:hypothetical protein
MELQSEWSEWPVKSAFEECDESLYQDFDFDQ